MFESDALFIAAASGNIKHLTLLSEAGADLAMPNYDKVRARIVSDVLLIHIL